MNISHDRVLFREEQQFGPWVWGLPAAIAGVLAWIFLSQGLGRPTGGRPSDVVFLAVGLGVSGLTALLIRVARLTVEVRSDSVRVRFFPFSAREILASDIVFCEVRQYRPIVEYGGWGVRYGFRRGWAYNVKGTLGVQLRLRDGRQILLGSQQPDGLARAIRSTLGR